VPQDTTLDIRILGSGFDVTAEAEFLLDGQPDPGVRTNSTRFVKSTEVVANVTIALDAEPTLYDAQVTLRSNGKKGIGTEKLTVLAFVLLGPGTASSGWGVNDEGSVTGRSDTAGSWGRTFVWDARTVTMRYLGWLEGNAINNARTVVGLNVEGKPMRWVYDEGPDAWVPELLASPNRPDAGVSDINQLGQMVGAADSVVSGVGGGAVLWQSPAALVPLDPSARFTLSDAAAINAGGQVVGRGRRGQRDTAWVWVPDVPNGPTGTLVMLPPFQNLPTHRAEGVNDAGDVVGWAVTTKGATYAILWRRNPAQPDPRAPDGYLPPIDLGAALGRNGKAYDINNASKVVGTLRGDAFVWDPENGARLLPGPPGGSGSAVSLNESVPTIATGNAVAGGTRRAIRWVLP
jgi:probable HAF family extracellular repeat protein